MKSATATTASSLDAVDVLRARRVRRRASVHESAGTWAVSIKHCRHTGQMSDFFAGLGGGFKFPDTQRNGGPLPGAPAGGNATMDGRINYNSALLEGVTPYAGPKGGKVGSDRNYQQVSLAAARVLFLSLFAAPDSPPRSRVVSVSLRRPRFPTGSKRSYTRSTCPPPANTWTPSSRCRTS